MGLYIKEYNGDPLSNGHSIWKTFYVNGQVYEAIPAKGYADFNKAESEGRDPNFWNRYITNAPGHFTIERPGVVDIDVQINEWGTMETGSQFYQRCKPIDGLRLDIFWTSVSNPDDPNKYNYPAGKKPVITFSGGGQFTDKGIFNTALEFHEGGNLIKIAVSGTHEITDYAIILHYSDGHVKQAAFTGFMSIDLSLDNKTLFISTIKFRKRRA